MKRLCTLFIIAMIVVSCGKGYGELPPDMFEYKLEITSDTNVWVEGVGGEGVITYTIENEQSDLTLKAESSVDWITIVEFSDVVRYSVDNNASDGERRGDIVLSYGTDVCRVHIMQHANIDSVYEALTTSGSLYYGGEEGVYNYYIVLSIDGMSESGNLKTNTTYYYFDLYSSAPAEGDVATIPNGTYTLSWDSNLTDGMIGYEYSSLTVTYDYDYEEVAFTDAELTVADNTIVATVSLATGERVRVEYSGSLDIPIYSSTVTEGLSTLTSDHIFDIEDGVFVGAYVGDMLYNGCNTCQVYMFEYLDYETGEERGDQFQIDLQLPYGETDICGSYTAGVSEGHFIPGSAEDLGGQLMQQNSWYMTAGYIDFAPLVSGLVTVERNASDVYIFTIDTVDDRGNAIKGVFKARGEFTEW